MIDPKLLRSAPEQIARNLARRGYQLDVQTLQELEEKRKMRQELEIAHRIQQGFFPDSMPEVHGLEMAGTCQPALEVGGD